MAVRGSARARPVRSPIPVPPAPGWPRRWALWRGPAFAEVADEPWAAAETARLNELRLVARELHVAAGLRPATPRRWYPRRSSSPATDRMREEGWRLHALALWSSGRQADALAALRRARATFADELGLDPGPDLVALEEAILAQRMDVLRAAVPPPTRTHAAAAQATAPPPPNGPARRDNVRGAGGRACGADGGRGEAVADGARVALVTGEAGLGKSTLLEHLGARLGAGRVARRRRAQSRSG